MVAAAETSGESVVAVRLAQPSGQPSCERLPVFGQAIVGGPFAAGLEMILEIAALEHLGAVLCEWAVDQQLVEKLVDQDVGFLAVLQNHRLSIHRAEVLLHQEVGETQGTVGVSTRSVQRV